MFTMDVSLPLAFGAGLVSFFTPCILPMVPAYIMYITGSTMEADVNNRRMLALLRTLGFVIGFTIIFMIMGTSASFVGRLFIKNKDIIGKISGIVMVLLGLNLMGVFKLGGLNKEKRFKLPKNTSWFSSLLIGMAFAAGWTPCFGPVLGAILVYAGKSSTLGDGVLLLLVYSIGMGIPFILTSLFINEFNSFLLKNEKFFKYIPKISGLLILIFGILVYFDKVINISRLLI